jgi:hypothetical protein
MHNRHALVLALAVFGSASTALACGPSTVALIESLTIRDRPPLFRCGSQFNKMLADAHKKDWRGALAAYEAHLANLGRWEAGSSNALETLAYLRRKAEAQ